MSCYFVTISLRDDLNYFKSAPELPHKRDEDLPSGFAPELDSRDIVAVYLNQFEVLGFEALNPEGGNLVPQCAVEQNNSSWRKNRPDVTAYEGSQLPRRLRVDLSEPSGNENCVHHGESDHNDKNFASISPGKRAALEMVSQIRTLRFRVWKRLA
jgi:hypothetical protein